MSEQRHSQPTLSSLGEGCTYACVGVTCHLHFWQNDGGLLCDTVVTWGVQQTPNKCQHTKLALEKKFVAVGSQTHNLLITSPALLPTS